MVRGEWRAHPVRTLVAVLAIAVGVALGFAVHLVNRSALAEFDTAVRSVSGGADLRIVQELARHALLSTTAVYVATTDVRKRDALALLG
jgi:site-specific recombinase XerC